MRGRAARVLGLAILALAGWAWVGTPPAEAAAADAPVCPAATLGAGTEGIVGTGRAPGGGPSGEEGVGGTGRSAAVAPSEKEGGVGGTGVLGTVTGFGSVCVNGLEIAYDASTVIEVDGHPAPLEGLARGQIVSVVAAGPLDRLHATRIGVRHAAVGPVSLVDRATQRLRVLGVEIRVAADTRVWDQRADAPLALDGLAPGQFVSVSGLPLADGSIHATRIDRIAPLRRVRVAGPLEREPGGTLRVAGLQLDLDPSARPPAGSQLGAWVVVSGEWDAAGARLARAHVTPWLPEAPRIRRLSVEGFVADLAAPARLRLSTQVEVDLSSLPALPSIAPGERVHVLGVRLGPRRLRAEALEIVRPPERPEVGRGQSERLEPDEREELEEREEGDRGQREVERPEGVEREEGPEVPEAVEAPERIELPESIEVPEVPGAPEVPEPPEPAEPPEPPEGPGD